MSISTTSVIIQMSSTRQTLPATTQCHKYLNCKPDQINFQSHSFSRSYRTILPTSLTYINLDTKGFSPWRPAADTSTVYHQDKYHTRIFKDQVNQLNCSKMSSFMSPLPISQIYSIPWVQMT